MPEKQIEERCKTSKIDAWRKFSSSTLLSGASLTDPRCAQLSVYGDIYSIAN